MSAGVPGEAVRIATLRRGSCAFCMGLSGLRVVSAGWHVVCEPRPMKMTEANAVAQMREVLRNRFPQLSDYDFRYVRGEEEQLVSHLQQRTGDSRESIAGLLRSVGVPVPVTSAARGSSPPGAPGPEVDHSQGSGIPDDTSRSGATSI
jgi:hypothetical protein